MKRLQSLNTAQRFPSSETRVVPRGAPIHPLPAEIVAAWPRHLIYHLYPLRDSVWRKNVVELLDRRHVFTGRRIVFVAIDERTESPEDVCAALRPLNAEIRIEENRLLLGEASSLIAALPEVLPQDGLTFYAHAKGVSHLETSVVFDVWTRLLYGLLDDIDSVAAWLSRKAFCGFIRAAGQPVAEGPYQWHFPGSFYWFRNDVVRQRYQPSPSVDRFFTEQFPSWIARFTESAALCPELLVSSPYGRQTWLPYVDRLKPPRSPIANGWHPLPAEPTRDRSVTPERPPQAIVPTPISPPIVHAAAATIHTARVSVVITCHNYGRFLGEAIQSVLDQSHPAHEILVVDDASTDDTRAVAARYAATGVRYRAVQFRNVHQTRHDGWQQTTGEFVLFLDADNALTRDYLRDGLAEFTHPQVGVVYADLDKFGRENQKTDFPAYSRDRLLRGNFVDACAIIRRSALEVTDAFERTVDPMQTQEDYLLFQRLACDGWDFRKQASPLRYRTHEAQKTIRADTGTGRMRDELSVLPQDVTLFIPLSGRRFAWEAQSRFLERQTWPRKQIRLRFCDTSQDAEFSRTVREWIARCEYADVRHEVFAPAPQGLADGNRRDRQIERQVQLTMCRIYNRLRASLETSWCWILEDDVIPPDDVLLKLMRHVDSDIGAVCAPYPSRWDPDYVVWTADMTADQPGHVPRATKPPANVPQVVDVRGSGFGCVVLREEILRQHIFHLPPDEMYYDQYFFRMMGDEWRRVCDWTVECQHLGS